MFLGPEPNRDGFLRDVIERWDEFTAPVAPSSLRRMTNGADPRCLLGYHDLFVQMADDHLIGAFAFDDWGRFCEDFDYLAFLESPGGVHAERTTHGDAAARGQCPHPRPRLARMQLTQDRGKGLACLFGSNGV